MSFALTFSAVMKALWPPPLIILGVSFFEFFLCSICFTRLAKLRLVNFPVYLISPDKAFVISLARNFAIFKDNYLIGVEHTAYSLRNHYDYGTACHFFKSSLDFKLRDNINGAGAVVQNKNIRFPYQASCY